ncbi:tetratricopeptide repeat protein [Altererythrobacter sp.]|uniref:tetratricopeptide repeat protein n=1 Tax=Altererythrobacter sp. TaxID=1872480 RepID=UPI003D14CFA9
MENESAGRGVSHWGVGLLLLAALLVAGVLAWRTKSDSRDAGVQTALEEGPLSVEELRARAEAEPGNPEGWQELGFALFSSGDFADAADAYGKATDAGGTEAVLWSALGEAKVMASEHDPMPADALAAFRKAIQLDPSDSRARYFLAVKKDLDGDHEGAISDWLALLADTPAGAPWERDLQRTIEQVGAINGIETDQRIAEAVASRSPLAGGPELGGGAGIPGPSQQQIAAAGAMSPDQQRDMAMGMVERLEQRLASDPSNVDGWVMLIRSRMTLGEPDKARKALSDAIAANPSEAGRLRQEAQALGVS